METKTPPFNFLLNTDSTNNCAMERVREGMAVHGEAWYAHEQTSARGQRGRIWESDPGTNITMSMAFSKLGPFRRNPFFFQCSYCIGVCGLFAVTGIRACENQMAE